MRVKEFLLKHGIVENIALLALLGVFLVLFQLKYFAYIFIIAFAIVGVVVFIILNKFGGENQEIEVFEPIKIRNRSVVKYGLNILFSVFYGLSFLTLLQGFYTKTVWYYVFISLCAGVIATEILFIKTKQEGRINLIKSLLLGLNLFLSNQILYPYGVGSIDSWGNIFGKGPSVTSVINTGYVPTGHTYTYFPLHFISVAADSLILSINPATVYYCLGGLVMLSGALCVFLLGRKFINLHFGLLAALIYPCLDYGLFYGSHAHQLAYALPFAMMAFTIIVYKIERIDTRLSILILLLFIALLFTHHLSSLFFFFILISMLIVEILQHIENPNCRWIFPNVILMYVVCMLAHWMYLSGLVGLFASTLQVYHNTIIIEAATARVTLYDTLPIRTLFLNTLGSGILIMLSVIGFLSSLRKLSFFKNIVMGLSAVLILIIGMDVVTPGHLLMPQRLYAFLEAFGLVFLAACAILYLFQQKYTKTIAVVLIVFLVFFSAASTIAGFETSLFLGEQGYVKRYDTPYERCAEKWREGYVTGNFSDIPFKEDMVDAQNITEDSFFSLNKFGFITGFKPHMVGDYYRLGGFQYIKPNKEETLYLFDKFDKYYGNGMVDIYYKK